MAALAHTPGSLREHQSENGDVDDVEGIRVATRDEKADEEAAAEQSSNVVSPTNGQAISRPPSTTSIPLVAPGAPAADNGDGRTSVAAAGSGGEESRAVAALSHQESQASNNAAPEPGALTHSPSILTAPTGAEPVAVVASADPAAAAGLFAAGVAPPGVNLHSYLQMLQGANAGVPNGFAGMPMVMPMVNMGMPGMPFMPYFPQYPLASPLGMYPYMSLYQMMQFAPGAVPDATAAATAAALAATPAAAGASGAQRVLAPAGPPPIQRPSPARKLVTRVRQPSGPSVGQTPTPGEKTDASPLPGSAGPGTPAMPHIVVLDPAASGEGAGEQSQSAERKRFKPKVSRKRIAPLTSSIPDPDIRAVLLPLLPSTLPAVLRPVSCSLGRARVRALCSPGGDKLGPTPRARRCGGLVAVTEPAPLPAAAATANEDPAPPAATTQATTTRVCGQSRPLIWYFDADGTPLCDACYNRKHGRVLEQRPRPARPPPPTVDEIPGGPASGERDAAAATADHADELDTSMQRRQSAASPGPAAMDVDSRRESVPDASVAADATAGVGGDAGGVSHGNAGGEAV